MKRQGNVAKVGTLAAAARAPRRPPEKVAGSALAQPDDERRERHRRFVPTVDVSAPKPKPRRRLAHFGERRSRRVCAGGHEQ